ncbi:DHHA1 domain-containing protein [Clostridium sediminicola]|uniref:alanyl-tRNA editing protein n=1 Tax=Clostridium sediminicola TaxID=3114879 RepID=UPI0031F2482F
MQRIFYENPYEKEFTAEIINVIEKNNEYHVELDKTNFYPGNSDGHNDTGYIDNTEVLKVYEKDDIIYHVVKTKPIKIHRVKCSIKWEKRYEYMQKHLGWHLLSASLLDLFNLKASEDPERNKYNYMDIDKTVDEIQIRKAEKMVNEIISNNISIEVTYPTKKELKKLSLQRVTQKKNKQIRVAKVGDIAAIPSEGIFPNSTIEIQMLKVTRWEKQGKGTRIHFICGVSAVSDYFVKSEVIDKITTAFKCNESEILMKVESLSDKIKNTSSENVSLKAKVAEFEIQNMLNECETVNNIKILRNIYDNEDLKYVSLIAKKLVAFPKVIVLFAIKSKDRANILFMCSKDVKFISMNDLLKDAITLIDGKGGGSNLSAQGGGKNNNNLDSTLDYAYNKVKSAGMLI